MASPAPTRWALTAVLVAAGLAAAAGFATSTTSAAEGDHHSVEAGVQFGAAGGYALTADVAVPDRGRRNGAAVVLVHGGGWTGGDKGEMTDTAAKLAEEGYVAATIDYRLAPDASVDDQVQDVASAVAWLRAPEQVSRYGIDPARVGLLGGSAGGHLVTLAAQRNVPVAAVVSWAGVYDFATTPHMDDRVLGCLPDDCPDVAAAASPVNGVTPTMPPTLLVSSSGDLIVSYRQLEQMQAALEAGGAVYATFVVEGAAHSDALRSSAWPETLQWFDVHLRT